MITIEHPENRNLIVIRASGTLTSKDYEHAIPELEHAMQLAKGPLGLLIRLEDFQGWEIDAFWRELEFDVDKRGEFSRVAVVCETSMEEWATAISAPFAKADVRIFPTDDEAEAEAWLRERPDESRATA